MKGTALISPHQRMCSGLWRAMKWAREWTAAKAQFAILFEDRFTAEPGPRIPKAVELINVGAVLPGTDAARAKEAIILTGHYDSRSSDVLDALSDAPGAVDDGSGTALTLELARVLASGCLMEVQVAPMNELFGKAVCRLLAKP